VGGSAGKYTRFVNGVPSTKFLNSLRCEVWFGDSSIERKRSPDLSNESDVGETHGSKDLGFGQISDKRATKRRCQLEDDYHLFRNVMRSAPVHDYGLIDARAYFLTILATRTKKSLLEWEDLVEILEHKIESFVS